MGPLELALSYLDIFFSGKDIESLRQILDEGCTFEGPLFQSRSAEDYITALQTDPPKECEYTIIQTFEHESAACVMYQFSKPGISIPMAQLFEVRDHKIYKILLIFNTTAFT